MNIIRKPDGSIKEYYPSMNLFYTDDNNGTSLNQNDMQTEGRSVAIKQDVKSSTTANSTVKILFSVIGIPVVIAFDVYYNMTGIYVRKGDLSSVLGRIK